MWQTTVIIPASILQSYNPSFPNVILKEKAELCQTEDVCYKLRDTLCTIYIGLDPVTIGTILDS